MWTPIWSNFFGQNLSPFFVWLFILKRKINFIASFEQPRSQSSFKPYPRSTDPKKSRRCTVSPYIHAIPSNSGRGVATVSRNIDHTFPARMVLLYNDITSSHIGQGRNRACVSVRRSACILPWNYRERRVSPHSTSISKDWTASVFALQIYQWLLCLLKFRRNLSFFSFSSPFSSTNDDETVFPSLNSFATCLSSTFSIKIFSNMTSISPLANWLSSLDWVPPTSPFPSWTIRRACLLCFT